MFLCWLISLKYYFYNLSITRINFIPAAVDRTVESNACVHNELASAYTYLQYLYQTNKSTKFSKKYCMKPAYYKSQLERVHGQHSQAAMAGLAITTIQSDQWVARNAQGIRGVDIKWPVYRLCRHCYHSPWLIAQVTRNWYTGPHTLYPIRLRWRLRLPKRPNSHTGKRRKLLPTRRSQSVSRHQLCRTCAVDFERVLGLHCPFREVHFCALLLLFRWLLLFLVIFDDGLYHRRVVILLCNAIRYNAGGECSRGIASTDGKDSRYWLFDCGNYGKRCSRRRRAAGRRHY